MDGSQVSDGYIIGNPQVTFSGIVSYSKIRNNAPTPQEFQIYINELIQSYTRFTFYGNALIPSLSNCVITNINVVHTNYSDAIEAVISLEQVFVNKPAIKTEIYSPIAPSVTTEGELAAKEDTGDGNKTQVDESEPWYQKYFDQRDVIEAQNAAEGALVGAGAGGAGGVL